MTDPITYTLATISDLPALEAAGDQVFDFPIKRERAIEFLEDDRHHLFLAFDKEEIVGMASGFHYVHPDKDPILFVNEVDVKEAYQSQGIGRNLVSRLCKYGRSIGCTEAWVATMQSNTPARKAFVAAGGVEEAEPVVLINYEFEETP